uniref:FBD domain-containing protein n=1 Tax=Oryza meridionalis TaxID=40149 RepID=A0A0E0C0S2_9ORYZ
MSIKATYFGLSVFFKPGFYGQKDQLELALYILRNSVRLKSMKINPKPIIAEYLGEVRESEGFFFLDGYQVALKFLCKEDRYNVVDVKEVGLSVIESAPDL